MTKKSNNQFITESINKFGDKFDYSKCNYINNNTDVVLICKKHNIEFHTKPRSHLYHKSGCCKICAAEIKQKTSHNSQVKSNEQFITESINKFGDKFDYSKCNYTGSKNNVTLKCNICNNLFNINARSHLRSINGGCKKCAIKSNIESRKLTYIDIINRCKQRHNSQNYDFSTIKDSYINTHNKIQIICKQHGPFWMLPDNFYNKLYDCPACNEKSKGESILIEMFTKNNIEFIHNKCFDNLYEFKGHNLSYDFYIKKYNLLIEFNGIQHYKFCKRYHRDLHDFHKQLHHDWLKRKYAKNNKFNYLTIDCRKVKFSELSDFTFNYIKTKFE